MVICRECGRPQSLEFCPGCLTLSRLNWLFKHRIKGTEVPEAIVALRTCAGVLTDLVEYRSGIEFEEQRREELRGSGAGSIPPEDREAGSPGKEKKSKSGEAGSPKERVPPGQEKEKTPQKGEVTGVVSEEVIDVEAPEKSPKGYKRHSGEPDVGERTEGAGVASPLLGLTSLPRKLSPPEEAGPKVPPRGSRHGGAQGGAEGQEERDKKKEVASGGGASQPSRPSSPAHPPRHQGERRERSRSPKAKKSKGIQKRVRGEDWRRSNFQGYKSQQWPPRQKQWWEGLQPGSEFEQIVAKTEVGEEEPP